MAGYKDDIIHGLGSWVDNSNSDKNRLARPHLSSPPRENLPVSWTASNEMRQVPPEDSLPSLTQQDTISTVSGTAGSGSSVSRHDTSDLPRFLQNQADVGLEGGEQAPAVYNGTDCELFSNLPLLSISPSAQRIDHVLLASASPSIDSSPAPSNTSTDSSPVSSPITDASWETEDPVAHESPLDWELRSDSPHLPQEMPRNSPEFEIPYDSIPVDYASPANSDGSNGDSDPPGHEEEGHQNDQASNNHQKKRTLSRQSPNHEKDREGFSGTKIKRVKTGDSVEDQDDRSLACPYYKKDPIRHRRCHRYLLKKISYVKQHLIRNHQQPIHCPRCMKEFSDDEDSYDHIRASTCQERPLSERPEGMTTTQLKQLRETRANQKHTTSEQWYEIFALLFPGVEPPSSPYLNKEHSEDMSSYIEFVEREGGNILENAIRDQFVLGDIEETAIRRVINDAIQQIYRAYTETVANNMMSGANADAESEGQGQNIVKRRTLSTGQASNQDQGERDATKHGKGSSAGRNHSATGSNEVDEATNRPARKRAVLRALIAGDLTETEMDSILARDTAWQDFGPPDVR
ncbi:hypothetical protein BGZ63DRAFT_402886 [Mariannaea sp. PMI_226]|nr:hypothetical protein BGZ63DRAFT_402886 [Mariannaea sp. PMI_226]